MSSSLTCKPTELRYLEYGFSDFRTLWHVQRSSNHFHFHILMDHQRWLWKTSTTQLAIFTNWSKQYFSNSPIFDYIWMWFFQEGKPKILEHSLILHSVLLHSIIALRLIINTLHITWLPSYHRCTALSFHEFMST